MMDECELLNAYGETCVDATGGIPVPVAVLVGIAAITVAVFQWAGRTGRLGPSEDDRDDDRDDDRYCDHEYDSYCGKCGLHIDGEDD